MTELAASADETADEIVVSRGDGLPVDIASGEALIELSPCDSDAVVALVSELGLHTFAAQTLVRRGYTTVESARSFITPGELSDPQSLPGAQAVAAAIAGHIEAGTRIAVHGDYDVDGVCSTAILVRTLALLNADVTWHVPSRFEDGYGLSRAAIDRLAGDGVGLIVTVDCGIGSVDEVAHAKSIAVDVAICDHHKIGEVLPEAPIVHPALGGYICPDLCAAATTYKLAQVLLGLMGHEIDETSDDLELVALATVCDVVPLRGENRALVQQGLAAMRQTLRPGLRELMRVAGVDQLKLDSGSLGFALGPRINAAGRMFSAEPAVELMLTTNESRAAELATELHGANARRREVEQEILFKAETQARQQRDQFAIVVAGEDWHPGVLGIVAGRIAERFHRPCVALAIEHGVAAGSGRAGGSYDLHAGLTACADLLVRFGGHKAAAGLELDVGRLAEFTRRFQEHAAQALTVDELRPRASVDAVGEPSQISLDAVESLAALGPFGAANREPQLLLPGVTVSELRKMGDRGQHLRLGIAARGGKAGVVAFNWEQAVKIGPARLNMVVRLARNEFRGTVEAQAKLVALGDASQIEPAADWETQFMREYFAPPLENAEGAALSLDAAVDRRKDSPLAVIAELGNAPAGSVIVVNDPVEWAQIIAGLAAVEPSIGGIPILAYGDAELTGAQWSRAVLVEPPPVPELAGVRADQVVIAWNRAGIRVTASRGGDLFLDRDDVIWAFRIIKEAEEHSWAGLMPAIIDGGRTARIAAHAVRTLSELSLIRVVSNDGVVEAIEMGDSVQTELDRSQTFRSYSSYREESPKWLHQISADQ